MDKPFPKKILFVITKSNWGGAQQYVYTLATHFKEAGADVAVVLGGTGEPGAFAGLLETRLAEAGVRTIFLKTFARDISLRREFRVLEELHAVIRKEKPDVLHLNSSKAGGIGALAGRMEKVSNIIFTAHGWAHREQVKFSSKVFRWIASWASVSLAHRVIVLSNTDFEHSPVIFSHKKIARIYNGIESFVLVPREEARASLITKIAETPALPFWFMTLAELHKNKGLDILIRAFAQVPQSTLVIIGEGEARNSLKNLIVSHNLSERVFLAGFVPNARELLCASDAFVLPSRKEGLPFTLLEAGIAHLPVIVTNVGAMPEAVENEVSGLVVSPDHIDELVGALQKIRSDSERSKEFADAFHTRILKDFSQKEMLEKTVALY